MPAGRRGRPTTPISCKARDAGDGVVEFDRVALAFAHDDRRDCQFALRQTSSAVSVWLMVPR